MRVPVGDVIVALDDLRAHVANISRTGALLAMRCDVPVGHEALLTVNTDKGPVSVPIRVVRSRPDRHAPEGQRWWLVAVTFTDASENVGRIVHRLMQAPRWGAVA